MTKTSAALALGAATALAAAVMPAAAADLGAYPRPASRSSYYEPVSIERWTGFYFGATLGYASGTTGVDGGSGQFGFDQSGGLGTAFAGYNWQLGSTVVGLEADIGTGNLGGSAISAGRAINADLNAFGSVRARAGFLMTPVTLLYATGGLAWADYDFHVSGAGRASDTLAGYQLGAGIEYQFAPQLRLRLEYIYTDLSAQRFDHAGIVNTYDPDFHTLRAGLSFRF